MQKKTKPRTKAEARILESAVVLFSRHGFDGATIREITKYAHTTPMTLYRGFPNKEKLIRETLLLALKRHFEPSQLLMVLYADAANKGLSELLPSALLRWYHSLAVPATKLLINAYASHDEQWRSIAAQAIEDLTKILTTFIDRNVHTSTRRKVAASRTVARTLLTILLYLKITSPQNQSRQQQKQIHDEVEETLEYCLVGLHRSSDRPAYS